MKVPWDELEDAYGPAGQVGELLEQLEPDSAAEVLISTTETAAPAAASLLYTLNSPISLDRMRTDWAALTDMTGKCS